MRSSEWLLCTRALSKKTPEGIRSRADHTRRWSTPRWAGALLVSVLAAQAQTVWRAPAGVTIKLSNAEYLVTSTTESGFDLVSEQELPARPGDVFEISVRIKVDLHTRSLPELSCYDAAGREIAGRSALDAGPSTSTTNWQDLHRMFPVLPGTAHVRARIRASGKGEIRLASLVFRPAQVDTYKTGTLVSQIYPRSRSGLVLESNPGIVNTEQVSRDDRDGDGKWALILVDLDQLSKMEEKGVDWRTKFEYKPNEIYWSDGAVLKSDTVREDRAPDFTRALHFRMQVHAGPYHAILNDPGRAVAVSVDGKTWQRFEGGEEAELGVLPAKAGVVELWVDACYRDPVSVGPVYFDYLRLFAKDDAASDERLFKAAWHQPPVLMRGSVEEKKVPVKVAGGSPGWPVRCSLPVPRGELKSADNVTVLNDAGAQIATQNRALAVWPDGSVKWLYLDFFKSADNGYTVAYGNAVHALEPAAKVRIQKTAAGIEVDTGAVQFLVPKSHFGMIEDKNGPVRVEVTEASGRVWKALDLPVENLAVEQTGMHAVIVAETRLPPSGKPSSGFMHRAAIHAYAGSPLVEIDYFIANTDDREQIKARSIVMKIPCVTDSSLSPGFTRTEGWIAPKGSSLSAGVQWFRELAPKALRWKSGELQIDLWAPEGGDYEWVQGVGKTHHIALWYGEAPKDGAQLANGPALALAGPEWYAASGAFGPVETAAKSPLPAVEKTLSAHMANTIVGKVGLGFENYGDHSSSGYVAGSYLWDNNEYDVPAGAMIYFVRTGEYSALNLGLASALHYLDVDTIHYSRKHGDWGGAPHTHSHDDTGPHTAAGPNMHHAGYVQGLIWYSYFTGDPAGIAGAKTIADWVLHNLQPEENVGHMERALGHPLMTLTDVYEATGEEKYLRGAARLVDWAEKWEHPVHSGFLAPITEQPAYYSGSGFNSGLIEAGLMKFNSWADLPEIDAMLERDARFLLTEMWRPPAGILSKGGSPRRGAEARHVSSHLRLMRLEYLRTKDPLFLAAPREMLVDGFGAGAKEFGPRDTGLVFNYVPWYLSMLRDLGDPQPDAQLQMTAKGNACVSVHNAGAGAVENLRVSYQPRLDFTVVKRPQVPDGVAAGATVELCGEVQPPERINLTSDYNRVSYAQWSASFDRAGKPRMAHTWAKITLDTRQ
jgi:hypothetical protein